MTPATYARPLGVHGHAARPVEVETDVPAVDQHRRIHDQRPALIVRAELYAHVPGPAIGPGLEPVARVHVLAGLAGFLPGHGSGLAGFLPGHGSGGRRTRTDRIPRRDHRPGSASTRSGTGHAEPDAARVGPGPHVERVLDAVLDRCETPGRCPARARGTPGADTWRARSSSWTPVRRTSSPRRLAGPHLAPSRPAGHPRM